MPAARSLTSYPPSPFLTKLVSCLLFIFFIFSISSLVFVFNFCFLVFFIWCLLFCISYPLLLPRPGKNVWPAHFWCLFCAVFFSCVSNAVFSFTCSVSFTLFFVCLVFSILTVVSSDQTSFLSALQSASHYLPDCFDHYSCNFACFRSPQ